MLFNEKVSCGLGRGIASTGRMDEDGVAKALAALRRYKALCEQAKVGSIHVLATAAAREAANGPAFVVDAETILGTDITILSGKEEAHYSAQGILAAFRNPDGFVGDLGGGSLELIDVSNGIIGAGTTLPLGVIRLQERSDRDMKKAAQLAAREIAGTGLQSLAKGRSFYAVGGTWRNFAKLHMAERGYPLHVTHAYEVEAADFIDFLDQIAGGKGDRLQGIDDVSKSRRALLPFGAVVLKAVVENMQPSSLFFSAYGVREGFLYDRLDEATQQKDALLEAADELAILRARSPRHARELAQWSARCFAAFGIDETADEARYRDAACRLADIGWRAHPDYRAAQSLAIIAYGHFVQISHQGRAFIALANYFRYQGLKHEELAPEIKTLTSERIWARAKLLGAFMRVGYLFTAAMPGVLDELNWEEASDGTMLFILPEALRDFIGERPEGRLSQLAKVTGRTIKLEIR